MFEKVNPSHPDKIADRIAGAIVDLAYTKNENPKVAVKVLIGHNHCHIINETSEKLELEEIEKIVHRISRDSSIKVDYKEYKQDAILAENQNGKMRCGDNGIFKGALISEEEQTLTDLVGKLYSFYEFDGKYLADTYNGIDYHKHDVYGKIIACQSNVKSDTFYNLIKNAQGLLPLKYLKKIKIEVNPLGDWTGGLNVDTGATNRKLGSDMGRAATGGGLHGKDLSKADVSVNIYMHLLAQRHKVNTKTSCAIGDTMIYELPYYMVVEEARKYIEEIGGFEKFAEWGLIRPKIRNIDIK